MEPIVALEIGAANCCAAVFRDGNVEMVPGSKGCFLTPSVVAFHRTGTIVGQQAREEMEDFPDRTVYASESLHAAKVKTASYSWDDLNESVPYEVETDKYGEISISIGDRKIEPKKVIRHLIEHMMNQVRSYIKQDITDVVMCIPPKTSFKRRKMLKEAAKEKGVTVTRFVTSTVAAALKIAFERRKTEDKKNFLVVDMGASQTTVSVVALGDEILENVATENVDFGGDALDAKIIKSLVTNPEVFSSPSALVRLRNAIHLAKIELSSMFARTDSTEIAIQDLLPGFNLKDKIRNSSIKKEFVAGGCKLSKLINQALQSSKLLETEIDEILLIGGSSALKHVKSAVEEKFPGKPISKDKLGHSWSVTGAAVQMAILKDCLRQEWPQKPLVLDKLNLKIGYESQLNSGEIVPVLSPKTDIPTKVATSVKHLRSSHKLNVYDCTNGESTKLGAEFLGYVEVAKVIEESEDRIVSDLIEITFDIEANGVLIVTVKNKHTEKSYSATINDYKQSDVRYLWRKAYDKENQTSGSQERKKPATKFIHNLKESAKRQKLEIKLTEKEKRALCSHCSLFEKWVEENPGISEEQIEERRKEIEELCNNFIESRRVEGKRFFS